MRSIKFRYKFKVAGNIIYCIYSLDEIERGKTLRFCHAFEAEILSRSQFIGFSDEGGREIYEGDGLFFAVSGISGRVEWDNEYAEWTCRNRREDYSHSFSKKERMTVVDWLEEMV